jgi:hypothetical protein
MKRTHAVLIAFLSLATLFILSPAIKNEGRYRTVDESIADGVKFIVPTQNENGEFPTQHFLTFEALPIVLFNPLASASTILKAIVSGPTHNVFITAFVLHSLGFVEQTPEVLRASERGIDFLLSERDASGLWNYYGNHVADYEVLIPPDLDDSSVILALLKRRNVTLNPIALDRFMEQQTGSGAFNVWNRPINGKNAPECVVEANILYFLSSAGYDVSKLCEYLNEIVEREIVRGNLSCMRYYPSPASFWYSYSRAFKEGNSSCLAKSRDLMKGAIITQRDKGVWWNELDTCFAVAALLNLDVNATELDDAINYIVASQSKDGSWSRAPFHSGPLGFYGSKEFTTAICVEALAKYRLQR